MGGGTVSRKIGIGLQDFGTIRRYNAYYIDKTAFIKEWWENLDHVTLITRPRRFGKTLTMSMVEQFFSIEYAGAEKLFEGLSIWQEEEYRKLQGTYPVISLSFANIKDREFHTARKKICQLLSNLYSRHSYLLESDVLTQKDRSFFQSVMTDMGDTEATMAVYQMSEYLARYYGKSVIILLDEYDTPMQEAYVNGYWDEMSAFTRSLFNAAFKTNPYLERGIMTGITQVGKESIFSDLNNLEVVTTTSEKYEDSFGFTEQEVFASLEEYGLSEKKELVKSWYDGFTFGKAQDIYNPWSILNYLDKKKLMTYWANTSSNSLIGKLVRESSSKVKISFERLMQGEILETGLDEQIVFNQLSVKESAVWSMLLASGYLKVRDYSIDERNGRETYQLALTNKEVHLMFENMIREWFSEYEESYNDFIKALLKDDIKAMNLYMNRVALATFSFFDTGKHPSARTEPERFYHGFVLGLMVELADRYVITSNRESGFGRYDVLLEPIARKDKAIILEFKVFDPEEERNLNDTVQKAHEQIERMEYAKILESKGIKEENIRKYAFAFEGKKVLIG